MELERKFLTIKEVHELTGLSIHAIRNRINSGIYKTLPRQKGYKILVFKDSVLGREDDGED